MTNQSIAVDEELEYKEIFQSVEDHIREERLLRAVDELKKLDSSLLSRRHREILAQAADFETAIADLIEDPNNDKSWKKHGESHGKRDALIYYKVDSQSRLTCRIETPIEASLLIPILSVLNESSLYSSWIPSWTMPKMGIDSSEQLEQVSRGSQIIRILANVPWPYSKREALIKAVAIDEIDERGFVAIRISSDVPVGGIIPPPSPQVERIDFEGAMLLRPCPRNHELLLKSKHVYREPLILVSFKMFADPRMTGIPTTFMNFVTRTAIGTIFFCFLDVAEAVKHGKRPKHMEAIAEKKDFYDWMALRIGILLEKAAVHDVLPPISKYMNEAKTSELEAHQAFISYLQS